MTKPNVKIINAWCMYDWANSAFQTTVMAAVIPIFFRNISAITLTGSQQHLATAAWGYTSAAAMLAVAVLSLLLGPMADATASKKRFLGFFMAGGALFTGFLALTGPGDWIWVSAFFIVATIGSAGSEVFYDALLPHIAPPGEMDRISTRGYVFGYIGGGILLTVNIAMIWFLPQSTLAGETIPLMGMRLSFLTVSIWWILFTLPLLRRVPEPYAQMGKKTKASLRVSISRLAATFREIRRYKQAFLFIIAFWFYNDGIGTIVKMSVAYGDEIGISALDLVGALLLTQFIGIPFTFLFGRIAKRIGAKNGILAGIGVYILIVCGAFFMDRALHFWILACAVGMVQGGTQALSRSLYGSMIPKEKSAEFFSFFAISGKFAGIAGPALFALASQFFKTSRFGILSLIFFFVIGGLFLLRVNVDAARKAAIST